MLSPIVSCLGYVVPALFFLLCTKKSVLGTTFWFFGKKIIYKKSRTLAGYKHIYYEKVPQSGYLLKVSL